MSSKEIEMDGIQYYFEGQTTHRRNVDGAADEMYGRSIAFDQNGARYIRYVRAYVRTYSNDPGNTSGAWENKDEQDAWVQYYPLAQTDWRYVGGQDLESGRWTCNLEGSPGLNDCYATTLHTFSDATGYGHYVDTSFHSSDDGLHSDNNCFTIPGCNYSGGGGGGTKG